MIPGSYTIVLGLELDALRMRALGWQLKDTFAILMPGPYTLTAFLFRWPLQKNSTIIENVLIRNQGGLNIDGCRVAYLSDNVVTPTVGRKLQGPNPGCKTNLPGYKENWGQWKATPLGRWPPNLILVHGPNCTQMGTQNIRGSHAVAHKGKSVTDKAYPNRRNTYAPVADHPVKSHVNQDGTETVPSYNCQPNCPVRLLDEQSGELKSGSMAPHLRSNRNGFNGPMPELTFGHVGDSGTASRFYPQFPDLSQALQWLSHLICPPP